MTREVKYTLVWIGAVVWIIPVSVVGELWDNSFAFGYLAELIYCIPAWLYTRRLLASSHPSQ